MTHTLTLKEIEPVTHDTVHLVFDRPEGYEFRPGQATLMRLDKEGWRDEKRPFSFTSLPDAESLEFVIKTYPERHGVTEQVGQMTPGDRVIIGEPWGAIEDRGPGVFVAGGAGVTPFIGILRARQARDGTLGGSTLVFSNDCERDIILREEWEAMPGLKTVFTLTEEKAEGLRHGMVDADLLGEVAGGFEGLFYVCGPRPMEDDLRDALSAHGVPEDRIVTEEH